MAWLFFDPVKLLVVFAAIADSWFNFRQRWAVQSGSSVSVDSEHDKKDEGIEQDEQDQNEQDQDKH